jgi:hypothetical protein
MAWPLDGHGNGHLSRKQPSTELKNWCATLSANVFCEPHEIKNLNETSPSSIDTLAMIVTKKLPDKCDVAYESRPCRQPFSVSHMKPKKSI